MSSATKVDLRTNYQQQLDQLQAEQQSKHDRTSQSPPFSQIRDFHLFDQSPAEEYLGSKPLALAACRIIPNMLHELGHDPQFRKDINNLLRHPRPLVRVIAYDPHIQAVIKPDSSIVSPHTCYVQSLYLVPSPYGARLSIKEEWRDGNHLPYQLDQRVAKVMRQQIDRLTRDDVLVKTLIYALHQLGDRKDFEIRLKV